MNKEQVFYHKGDVMVTNTRFVVPGQTFAMSGVTSVRSSEGRKDINPAILIIPILGLIGTFIVGGTIGNILLTLSLLVMVLTSVIRKKLYHVSLTTSSGEQRALMSPDRTYVEEVVSALNQAIVHRG